MGVLHPHSQVEPQGLAAGLPSPADSCSLRELAALPDLCLLPRHFETRCHHQQQCLLRDEERLLCYEEGDPQINTTRLLPACLMFRAEQLLQAACQPKQVLVNFCLLWLGSHCCLQKTLQGGSACPEPVTANSPVIWGPCLSHASESWPACFTQMELPHPQSRSRAPACLQRAGLTLKRRFVLQPRKGDGSTFRPFP